MHGKAARLGRQEEVERGLLHSAPLCRAVPVLVAPTAAAAAALVEVRALVASTAKQRLRLVVGAAGSSARASPEAAVAAAALEILVVRKGRASGWVVGEGRTRLRLLS